ncbi:MAG: DUF5658 family protein [Vicinamibacterales bacterium]
MFATARHASAVALAGVFFLGGTSPAFAADLINDKPLPMVDFTLADLRPFSPGVSAAILTEGAPAILATPTLADAPQTRPIEMAMPRGGSGSTSVRRSMYVSFAALQVMDIMSTTKALAGGATEANPVMSGMVNNKAGFYSIKAATAISTVFFAERLGKNHPRRAAIMMAVLNVGYAAVVAHNYRVANAR